MDGLIEPFKMDFSLGIDIQMIDVFENSNENFINKIFDEEEKRYCFSKSKPAQHLAARFCIKEAVIKAMTSFGKQLNYKDIIVIMEGNNPTVKLIDLGLEFAISCSLSHSGDFAIGSVMVKIK
jgi:holo-[acyl-carrier protein] synthase